MPCICYCEFNAAVYSWLPAQGLRLCLEGLHCTFYLQPHIDINSLFKAYKSSPCQWTIYSHHRRKPVNPETLHLSYHENLTTSLHTKHNKKALVKKMRKKYAVKKALIETTKEKKNAKFLFKAVYRCSLLDNGSHLG